MNELCRVLIGIGMGASATMLIKVVGSYTLFWQYNYFFSDEPITKTFRDESTQSQEEKTFFDKTYFYDLIKQGVSLIVVDPADGGDKIIGMRISGLCKRFA